MGSEMTKKPQTKPPKSRGRKPDRLIISEDPEIVLARLLNPAPPLPKPSKSKRTK
jgi:hypothetical protein